MTPLSRSELQNMTPTLETYTSNLAEQWADEYGNMIQEAARNQARKGKTSLSYKLEAFPEVVSWFNDASNTSGNRERLFKVFVGVVQERLFPGTDITLKFFNGPVLRINWGFKAL